ncbi:MAG: hypothetical protein PHW15_00145 [Patescibacteria group bacterium]|jgi:hypothetical protein|nr:hypothetical protein [Patescibacteria group bacterium]MDD5172664.1 hypothetical protein [Patescibacteria group bacterium]
MNSFNKIEASIPDEDVFGWIESLKRGGMSEEEIDLILERLNYYYRKAKNHLSVEEELEIINKEHFAKHGRPLDSEQKEYFRKGLKTKRGEK